MDLLDANVLLALAWPTHPFHSAAREWFEEDPQRTWGTCTLTASAFVRLSANPAVVGHARPPAEAWGLLRQMQEIARHRHLPDAPLPAPIVGRLMARCMGHRQVMDAWLVAIAMVHRARVVTFDVPLRALADSPSQVLVLSARPTTR